MNVICWKIKEGFGESFFPAQAVAHGVAACLTLVPAPHHQVVAQRLQSDAETEKKDQKKKIRKKGSGWVEVSVVSGSGSTEQEK